MVDLFSILDNLKNLSRSDFKNFKIFDETKDIVKSSNKVLDVIANDSILSKKPKNDDFNLVLQEFYIEESRAEFFQNFSMLKKLCWALDHRNQIYKTSIIENGHLTVALELIEEKFSTSMYSPLIYILFSNWTDSKVERLRKYLTKKLINESNKRGKVIYFQNHIQFISDVHGPNKWANQLIEERRINILSFFELNPIVDSLKRTEFFKILTLTLFEEVAKSNRIDDRYNWQPTMEFAEENLEPSINKYMIAFEIYWFKEQIKEGSLKERIKNKAFLIIGDPIKTNNWLIEHQLINQDRIEILKKSRIILNQWINETLINLFFSKVVDDYDRRQFWKSYVDKMTSVDIFLKGNMLYDVLNDERVKDGLESRFGVLGSGGNTSSILIFTIGRFRFVLAGSTAGGALYVHPKGSRYYPNIEQLVQDSFMSGNYLRSLNKTNLTHSHLDNLIELGEYSNYYNDEGRMVHTGNWKLRLKSWMNKKID